MSSLRISPVQDQNRPCSQARYLTVLLSARDLSAREVARRSEIIAKELGQPELAVGHQAVSGWLSGARHPTMKHKEALSMILGVPVADLILACDVEPASSDPKFTLRQTTVVVPNSLQTYRYTLAIKKEIDLNQPAIYPDWSSMFTFPPTRLMRHLRNVRSDCFGWIPDNSANPMVHYPRSLVPVERMSNRRALRHLDSAESSQRRVWFVYVPGGRFQVGIGYRRNRLFALARNEGQRLVVQEFPLSRVDLVGYFTGNVVFYLLPATASRGAGSTDAKTEVVHEEVEH
jgi:hypothetical protein